MILHLSTLIIRKFIKILQLFLVKSKSDIIAVYCLDKLTLKQICSSKTTVVIGSEGLINGYFMGVI